MAEGASHSLVFFTVASEQNHHLERLLASARRFNIDVQILGLGQAYQGNGMKVSLLCDALKRLPESQLFLYVDAYDVIFLAEEAEIAQKYTMFYEGQLVFGAEQNFGMYSWDDIYYYLKYPLKKGRFRFLNAGTIMGRAGQVLAMYDAIGISSSQRSDQMDTIRYFSQHVDDVTVDMRHELFAVNGGRAGLEDRDYLVKNGRLYSSITDTWPTLFHVPGKFFMGLDQISSALGFMEAIPEYTKDEWKRYRSAQRDHRIVAFLGCGNYPYRLIKNWVVNVILLFLLVMGFRLLLFLFGR